jgi:H(+)-transporting ATP synthase subunit D
MITSTARSRLYELRRDRVAAHRSAELLERQREVLLRELTRRIARRDALRKAVTARHAEALRLLAIARVEMGTTGVAAAALAQAPRYTITSRLGSIMGVRLIELTSRFDAFRASYGVAATRESLDRAGAAFHDLLPELVRLLQEEFAVSRLRRAARKTTKLVNALNKIVLPRIEREIRATVEGIEEEERDENVRRKTHGVSRVANPL